MSLMSSIRSKPLSDLELIAVSRDVEVYFGERQFVYTSEMQMQARLLATISARDEEIGRLKDALRFYANEGNWKHMNFDKGYIAREALETIKEA